MKQAKKYADKKTINITVKIEHEWSLGILSVYTYGAKHAWQRKNQLD